MNSLKTKGFFVYPVRDLVDQISDPSSLFCSIANKLLWMAHKQNIEAKAFPDAVSYHWYPL